MKWTVHGEQPLYVSPWLSLTLADVEVPGGKRFDHHVIRAPQAAAAVLAYRRDAGVLLLWRHRFITDAWGWELPAGGVHAGEDPGEAARRETLEETGWVVDDLEFLMTLHPMNGICDQEFHVFFTTTAEAHAEPVDRHESERIEWLPLDEVRLAVQDGAVPDGLSLAALTYAFTFGKFH